MKNRWFSGLVLLLSVYLAQAQTDTNSRKIKIFPVPAIGHSPETSTYFGAVALASFRSAADTNTRESNTKVEFNYSLRNQLILECGWNYFSPGEKWFSEAIFRFSQFPDYYYGLGRNSDARDEVQYNSNRFRTSVNALYQLRSNFFAGPLFRYTSYSRVQYLGGDSITYLELSPSQVWGLGLEARKDLRNSLLGPTEGYLAGLAVSYNQGAGAGYLKIEPDFRYYLPLGEVTWASRFYAEWNWGDTPPFYDIGLLGGDRTARGIYLGRFRDVNLSTLQTEFRIPLFWRLGVSFFGGLSDVYASGLEVKLSPLIYNAGGGIRFLIDRESNVNLRFDYGVASGGQSGFYVAFGESF